MLAFHQQRNTKGASLWINKGLTVDKGDRKRQKNQSKRHKASQRQKKSAKHLLDAERKRVDAREINIRKGANF